MIYLVVALALFAEMTFLDYLFTRSIGNFAEGSVRLAAEALRRVNLTVAVASTPQLVSVLFSNGDAWLIASLWASFIAIFFSARVLGITLFWRPSRYAVGLTRSLVGLTVATLFALTPALMAFADVWFAGFGPQTQAKQRALGQLASLYKLQTGMWPESAAALLQNGVAERDVRDAFLRQMVLEMTDGGGLRITSAGPDLCFGTKDDVLYAVAPD